MMMRLIAAASLLQSLLLVCAAADGNETAEQRRGSLDLVSPIGNAWRRRLSQAVQLMEADPLMRRQLRQHERQFREAAAQSPEAPFSFNCRLERSRLTPTSVHQLRPGDVDIIAAIGDSLTAANGALATRVALLLKEDRGFAWNMGGQVELRQHTTLANVLRKDNSDLFGYSIGNGAASSNNARLNYAVPGAVSADMPQQARALVERMKRDPKVDFVKDWKVITMMIGGNDICNSCKDPSEYTPEKYIANIKETLDYFHANVPRAFVNVAEVLDVSLLKELKDGAAVCQFLHGILMCRCGAFPRGDEGHQEIKRLVVEYQKALRELVDSGRYDTRSDFTVVNQPFLRDSKPPKVNGDFDQSFFAPDCFHFSRKGHAAAGKGLWNNMLEPVGSKSTTWRLEQPLKCPTSQSPYLRTRKN